MMDYSQNLLQNVHHIRKMTQRSIHDCASFLNLSNTEFIAFERGENFLSLPQIELLSAFLSVSAADLFQEDLNIRNASLIQDRDLHQSYQQIRQKMILAEISLELKEKNLSLNDLYHITLIPIDTLENYLHNGAPIPIHHMLKILQALDQPIDLFLENNLLDELDEKQSGEQTKWQPEFPDESHHKMDKEDPYLELRDALQSLPKSNQAEILKALLTLLKTKR